MRRKSDSWINATHILKIAKFPKAKRTRILEKDVQSGIHEKVQGGYGKYQGTYVPLDLGADLAKEFDVYDSLRPIFEFSYVEGRSQTPPPAPKHSHASALNVAKRQASLTGDKKRSGPSLNRRPKLPSDSLPTKKRGRPRRSTDLQPAQLARSDTAPIHSVSSRAPSFSASRMDTDRDALLPNSMALDAKDLQLATDEDDDDEDDAEDDDDNNTRNSLGLGHSGFAAKGHQNGTFHRRDDHVESQELISGRELFGNHQSFDKLTRDDASSSESFARHDPYTLNQFQSASTGDAAYADYFNNLLTYFLDDTRIRSNSIPSSLLHPPQPLHKINIERPIDNDGNTVFHWACSMANSAMIEFLLSVFEVNPRVRNLHGETPLMFMVRFTNSFLLRNFATILHALSDDLILALDDAGKSVLHHIAAADIANSTREKCARYYLETVLDTLLSRTEANPKLQLHKFINAQDQDGNTAFHLVAYTMLQSCVKVFINHHEYVDLNLRNAVSCTVEDYLASHNFVLRLDNLGGDESMIVSSPSTTAPSSTSAFMVTPAHTDPANDGFRQETQQAIALHTRHANAITEKLAELGYLVQQDLTKRDQHIAKLHQVLHRVNKVKVQLQRDILRFFNLQHLIGEEKSESSADPGAFNIVDNAEQDSAIQDEIDHVNNDLCYQILQHENDLDKLQRKVVEITERVTRDLLEQYAAESTSDVLPGATPSELAVQLQIAILKRQRLQRELYEKQANYSWVPSSPAAEPKLEPTATKTEIERAPAAKLNGGCKPVTNRLAKYVELISKCCGLDVAQVTGSIGVIEQSLLKSRQLQSHQPNE